MGNEGIVSSLHDPLTSCFLLYLPCLCILCATPPWRLVVQGLDWVSLCWVPVRFNSPIRTHKNPFRHMNQRMRQANPVNRICFFAMRDGSNSVTRSRLIATSWKANTVTSRGAYLMGLPPLRALSLLLKRTPPAALSPSVTLMRAPVLKAGRYSGTIECWMQTFQDASANLCKKQLYLIAWTLDHCCSEVLRLIHHSQQRCKVFPNITELGSSFLALPRILLLVSFIASASPIISIIFHIL